MRFCLSCGIAIAPDRLPDGFSPITIRATRKVPRRKDPSENCWMHIMTALPSQLPPPQEQLLLHELNHRIGNEFCCAISVVSLAAARSSDKEVKAVLTEVAELLTTMRRSITLCRCRNMGSAGTWRHIFASCSRRGFQACGRTRRPPESPRG